jgi:hypothetical protein
MRKKTREGNNKVKTIAFAAIFALILIGLYSFRLSLRWPFVELLRWENILVSGIIILVFLVLVAFYIMQYDKRTRLLGFLVLLVLVTVLMEKGADLVSPYLILAPLGVALAAIFLGTEIGFGVCAFLAILAGIGGEVMIAPIEGLIAFAGGMVAIFGTRNVRGNRDLVLVGLEIGIVNILLLGGTSLFWGVGSLSGNALFWTGLSGLISALLVMGGIPFAEYLTQKTSPIGLMELLNVSHPLLEKLAEEAPGTYHHSTNVAKLAANAARAIGADPLLCEVGGYYHDIGKLKRAEFFAENQEMKNPHDEITPSMSKVIITAHLKEGLEIGRKYGLKEDVLRFIKEHHGTSVIRYFYIKALRERSDTTSADEYRYSAELPKTKETAILMLADSVEAASRILEESSQIDSTVEEIIRDKLEDGQLDESPLTIADLHRIKEAFGDTLRAMLHSRPQDYPHR